MKQRTSIKGPSGEPFPEPAVEGDCEQDSEKNLLISPTSKNPRYLPWWETFLVRRYPFSHFPHLLDSDISHRKQLKGKAGTAEQEPSILCVFKESASGSSDLSCTNLGP